VYGVVGSTLPAGTTINGRYTIIRKLGSYGHVYEATDAHLNHRAVALKLLYPDTHGARPWDEAHLLERLRNRFLVEVVNADVVVNSDIRYIVTPLLSNGDLESAAGGTGLGVREAVQYIHQVATGIDRIHADGMIHRDIKPGNVLVGNDGVFVIDLEYCELLDENGRTDRNGSWCTVAPEAACDGGYCTVRSDVYSLGATAFFVLSGAYPVDQNLELAEQQKRIVAGNIRELRQVAPHISQAIGTVVRRALSLEPPARFGSAQDFGNALTKAARGSRDWRRVVHSGHEHCLEGSAAPNRTAVRICAVPDGTDFAVRVRLAQTGRRVANVRDNVVTDAQLPRTLRGLVKALG
jgi:serine/threonine protein kinase